MAVRSSDDSAAMRGGYGVFEREFLDIYARTREGQIHRVSESHAALIRDTEQAYTELILIILMVYVETR